jgi:serine phosphatase RsbU (regulator of sigma subunit)
MAPIRLYKHLVFLIEFKKMKMADTENSQKVLSPEQKLVEQLEKIRKENEMLNLNVNELTKTNEFLVTATWREREMKQRLHAALEELTETKKLVDAQHKSITDSINYASRIQDAIIPRYGDVKDKFNDVFIFHEAKDIVSGDFPWLFEHEHITYMGAVDCTGHGVPGAMMSLIGHLLLNDLVKHNTSDPGTLLTHLHDGVVRTLKQNVEGKQSSDGMDVAMCRIDRRKMEVQFSGAHRPLYHIKGGEVVLYAGDKFPIGGNQYKNRSPFTNHLIKVEPGESIYFFSDGLTDQFGGKDGLKFGPKRTREVLLENAHLTMSEQGQKIREAFDHWKGTNKQIDDLLLIGIKF